MSKYCYSTCATMLHITHRLLKAFSGSTLNQIITIIITKAHI